MNFVNPKTKKKSFKWWYILLILIVLAGLGLSLAYLPIFGGQGFLRLGGVEGPIEYELTNTYQLGFDVEEDGSESEF